jgi:hypothetical protein
MGFDAEAGSCYFGRQPATEDETYRAIRALRISCCGALRYRGTDPDVIERLLNLGLGGQVDTRLGFLRKLRRRVARDRVSFAPNSPPPAVGELAGRLSRAMVQTQWVSVTEPVARGTSASFVYTWYSSVPGLTLSVEPSPDGAGRWVVIIADDGRPAVTGVAVLLDDILRATDGATDLRWYTRAQWRAGRAAWATLPL